MDAHEDTRRIQVLSVSDTGRRRRWTDDEKVRIVEESHGDGDGDGVTLAEVARRVNGGLKTCLRIPEHPAGHSGNIRPPKPVHLATFGAPC